MTAHNTATHMQLIGYIMLDVSHLRVLHLLSRQRFIAQTGPFNVAFWCFTTQPIELKRFVKFRYAVIAHIAFHVYLRTYLLIFNANFQRFITACCQKVKHLNSMNLICSKNDETLLTIKISINSNTTARFSLEKQPRGIYGLVPAKWRQSCTSCSYVWRHFF